MLKRGRGQPFLKGSIPWNKGLKGSQVSWCKGLHIWENRVHPSKGKTLSDDHKRKLSISHMGKRAGMTGKKHSIEMKIKTSATKQGIDVKDWRGFVSSKDKLLRERFRKELQREILKRDDYTCQLCGTRGVDLQVDHIQSWAEYVELRFDINNCRTLCAKCHYQITYGKPMPPSVRAWGHNLLGGTENTNI